MEQTPSPARHISVVKILAAVLFIVLPLIGFWLGMEYEKIQHRPSVTIVRDPCDITNDNQCDDKDRKLFQSLIGECITGNRYNALADADHDGCITVDDQKLLFSNAISPSPTSDETAGQIPDGNLAGWKTYRNEEYGFEYPSEWEFFDVGLDNAFSFGEDYFPDSMFHIRIDNIKPEPYQGECKDILVDMRYGTRCTWRRHIDSTHGVDVDYYLTLFQVIFSHGNNYYEVTYSATDDALQKKLEIFDHILSTFRFVDTVDNK